MNKKFLLAAGVSSVALLAGCASGPDEATTNQISQLSEKVDQLSSEIDVLKADQAMANDAVEAAEAASMQATEAADAAMTAQAEAERANERIDNIAQSYTK